jgi:hypothetical protein
MIQQNAPAPATASPAAAPAAPAAVEAAHVPASTRSPPDAATGTTAPIPFRRSEATSGPEVFGVLATTLLLLSAFYGLAWYARKRGWLQRWGITADAPGSVPARRLQVLERLPLSRRTTLFRVRDGEREYLLAETSAGAVQLAATTVSSGATP